MKNLNKILKVVCILVLAVNIGKSSESKLRLSAENIKFTQSNVLEFDIMLSDKSDSRDNQKYFAGQYVLNFNSEIANSGTLTYTFIKSDLPEAYRPIKGSVSGNQLRLSCNNISSLNGSPPEIRGENILIARMELRTSSEKFANENLILAWPEESSLLRTKIFVTDNTGNPVLVHSIEYSADGSSNVSNVENENSLPTEYRLAQNYPNPFNPSTSIRYELPSGSFVKLSIYDITGRVISELVNKYQDAGRYERSFNGSNFASGVYFYKIQSGDFSAVKRMVLIK